MDIYFSSNKDMRIFNSDRELQKKYGHLSKKIQQRLVELRAVNFLADISDSPPPRRHKLVNDREGQWAVDLNGNKRLIFEPSNDPIPKTETGAIDLTKVTEITIIEVADYH
ncbi:MAG: killer suppression protein HigA [Candidatus Omnitrophota bacterium]